MAGEQAPVGVAEDVAIELADHLISQGRLSGPPSPQMAQAMAARLGKSVASSWGIRAKRFEDDAGGGWLCDVSGAYEGEIMFGVVRSGDGGGRHLVECVDEDAARALATGSKRPDQPTTVNRSQAAQPTAQAAPPVAVEPLPGEPRLIVYWEGPLKEAKKRHQEGNPSGIEQTTYAEASERVMELLMEGCIVEVWSEMKRPKLTVSI